MNDLLKKYLFEDHSVRVQAVSLRDTWRQALLHQHYPEAITRLLGELVAASTLLAANLKFDGSLVLQIQGDGLVALVVVECHADLGLRATVKIREGHSVPESGTMQSLLNPGGKGHFIVVLDPRTKLPGQQAYQGIVPLEGETVAEVLQHYMKASEQLDTRLWLSADGEHVAGLLLQRLPDHGGVTHNSDTSETWERAVQLTNTLKPDELLSTDTDTLIHRLYWQENLSAFEPNQVRWHCPCTRQRVASMLRSLGQAEVEDILSEQETVTVSCDFCGKPYFFDPVDYALLFTSDEPATDFDDTSIH